MFFSERNLEICAHFKFLGYLYLELELELIPLNSIQQQQTQDGQRLPLWCVGKGNIQNIIWQRFAQKLERVVSLISVSLELGHTVFSCFF